MRIVLTFILAVLLCMFSISAIAQEIPNTATGVQVATESGIPNMATEGEDVNGRAVKLDKKGDEEGTELTPVERRIIVRYAIISNAPALGN